MPESMPTENPTAPASARKKWPLHVKILLGLVIGAALGALAHYLWGEHPNLEWWVKKVIRPIGQIFTRMIFMVVIPLVFTALAIGVAGLKDLVKLGRVGIKTLIFTILISSVAVAIGIGLVQLTQPGVGMSPEAQETLRKQMEREEAKTAVRKAMQSRSAAETIVNIIPQNPLVDAVEAFNSDYTGGGLLSVMFFALIFGIALAVTRSSKTEPVIQLLEGLFEILMKIIGFAMLLAPLGVGALLFSLTATIGLEILLYLMKYVLVVLLGLALHQFGVYSLLLRFIARMNPLEFFRKIREAMMVAFGTASSNVTLPTSLRVTEKNLGVPRDITGFVLTLGSTANQNGTALFEGVTVLFLAQFFGIPLEFHQQVMVVLMCILAGVGTAGIPGGSLPMIVLVLQSVKVPGEAIGIIWGVNHFLDMCRTTVNVTGDIVIAACVARSERAREGSNTSV